MLEALKREADKDLDFATFLIKYMYAVHQVTPPTSPRLETDIKEIWGLNIGKRGVEALTAKEEDTLDEVLGRPRTRKPWFRLRTCIPSPKPPQKPWSKWGAATPGSRSRSRSQTTRNRG